MINIYIQTVLVGGTPSNFEPDDLAVYFDLLARIQPRQAHIYSIDRPVFPNMRISLLTPDRLDQIARRCRQETGVMCKAFYSKRGT